MTENTSKKIKKYIVITSIFNPTEAIEKFAQMKDWHVIVVGDKKSPKDWSYPNCTYLSPEAQQKLDYNILKHLPWNHYCRKLIGYVYAMSQGAEVIYDTDDDNIPLDNWSEPAFSGTYPTLSGIPFVNIYKYFTEQHVWPRGLPLKKILSTDTCIEETKKCTIGVWQFLANGDPDVDAIYRLTDNTPIIFNEGPFLALDKHTICPTNSQNTFFTKQTFPLLYLPAFVTFRFTDILRGLIMQPALWSQNMHVGFGKATVYQKRNAHDYLKDFEQEIPVYLYTEKTVKIASQFSDAKTELPETLLNIYRALAQEGIVPDNEIDLVNAWIEDIKRYI